MATTYEKIASVTVGSGGAADITFSSIPATFDDLIIFTSYRTNRAQVYDQLRLQFNGSTASNYDFRGITGDGGAASSESTTNGASLKMAPGGGNNATANTFTNDNIYIPNYRGSTNKSVSSEGVGENNASEAYRSMFAGLWKVADAITSIKLFPEGAGNFLQYSTATLYGIRKS